MRNFANYDNFGSLVRFEKATFRITPGRVEEISQNDNRNLKKFVALIKRPALVGKMLGEVFRGDKSETSNSIIDKHTYK